MSRISLFDGHDCKLPRTRLVRPDAFDIGHSRFFEIFPDVSRARNRTQQGSRVRRARRIRTGEDRIVAIKNPFDADEWLGTFRASVIARPFAKGSFISQIVGSYLALQHDFSIRWVGESGNVALDDCNRCPFETAGIVEFAQSGRDRASSREPNQWIASKHDIDGKRKSLI